MINNKQYVDAAVSVIDRGITYKQEDCQAFVENTVKRAGGTVKDFMGSNHMLRSALTKLYELPTALKQNLIRPGWLVFIVEPGHNSKYDDEMGNASHVGIFTGRPEAEVMHSSASRGGVFPSTLKNAWTHAGPPNFISFESSQGNDYGGRDGQLEPRVKTPMRVLLPGNKAGETINVRSNPNSGAAILATPRDGDPVMASEQFSSGGRAWREVTVGNVSGFAWAEFFGPINSTDQPPYFPSDGGTSYIPIPQPESLEGRVKHLEDLLALVMEEIGSRWR